jgi:hypothetical protein
MFPRPFGFCSVPLVSFTKLFAFSVPIVFLLINFSLLCSDWLFLFFPVPCIFFHVFLLFLVYFYFFLSVFSSLFLFGFLPYFPFPSRVFSSGIFLFQFFLFLLCCSKDDAQADSNRSSIQEILHVLKHDLRALFGLEYLAIYIISRSLLYVIVYVYEQI